MRRLINKSAFCDTTKFKQLVSSGLTLSLLTCQNCALILLLSYTRTRPETAATPKAVISHVVCLQELCKFVISLIWCGWDVLNSGTRLPLLRGMSHEIVSWENAKPMLVPAALFTLQNTLLFVALENLEATLFQVVYQSRLLVAAVLMILLLGRTFSRQKWFSLLLLVAGIVLAQVNPDGSFVKGDMNQTLLGLGAAILCGSSSSLAGVYMEMIFKRAASEGRSTESSLLSTRNVHLSFYSMMLTVVVPQLYGLVTRASATATSATDSSSYFAGIDMVVWIMIFNQALGGVIVALVLKYADNILKGFATTGAILVSGVLSVYLFGVIPTPFFVGGVATVVGAVLLYGMPDYC